MHLIEEHEKLVTEQLNCISRVKDCFMAKFSLPFPSARASQRLPDMDRATAPQLLMSLMLVFLHPKAESWMPHHPSPPVSPPPLCASQFALANRACAALPYTPVSPPSPPSPLAQTPPAPPSPEERGRQHHRRHGHGHGHRDSRHRHRETPAEQDCCRWLKEVDDVCVCELLVHLPAFLTRPVHEYNVMVEGSCDITFACGSRLVHL